MKEKRKIIHGRTLMAAIFFLVIFGASFTILYFLNLVPPELQDSNITTEPSDLVATTTVGKKQYDLPIRIVIEKIGVNSIVQNPTTTDTDTLDSLLLHGAVRYPGSGLPSEGNMFMFGHSTGFKIVNNQAFKTFNNLKNLKAGDEVDVFSATKKYIYKVNNVKLVDAKDALVDFTVKKTMLTLSTCNTFGQKQERYVVEADYMNSVAI